MTTMEPKEVITRQTCSESVKIIKGKVADCPAWHVILVPYEGQASLEQKKRESWIQIDEVGRNIRYRDQGGVMRQASGYGIEPSEQLMKWINENYDPPAIDENTPLTYTTDDIRLCTIQRLTPEKQLGIVLHYHRHEHFHYIKLSDDCESTLAFRAGLKSFDRVIEFNGSNVEEDSADSLKKTIDNLGCQLFQLLVCSPATYAHYKTNKKQLHNNLDTVERLKPVHDIGNPPNNYEIMPTDNPLACITLINSMHTVGDTFGYTQFDITHEPFVANTTESRPPLTSNANNNSQALNGQHNDKKERREHQRERLTQQLTSLLGENNDSMTSYIEIHHIPCRACLSPRIFGDRYKCLECENYDLCDGCFNQRRETDNHRSGHVMVYFSDRDEMFGEPLIDTPDVITLNNFKAKYASEEHTGFECNECRVVPIKGLRFKCDVCDTYDLCITCMEKGTHDRTHTLLAIGKSQFSEISMSDIKLNGELGRGAFGTVYKAKWLSRNQNVACKVIDVKPGHSHLRNSFWRELIAYTEVPSSYILKTYGYHIEQLAQDRRRYVLVMEFMARGSLSSVLRGREKISLRLKLDMACQIASGMRKLHAHRMIHRDIRPDNILVTQDYTAKIGDMGIARKWMPDENLTAVGCLFYMPLEFYTGKYDQSLDVYTFGLTIYELFAETRHQFNELTRRITLTKRSPIFADLIDRCVHDRRSQRPTAIEIETTLRMYKQAIERHIMEKNIRYVSMSTEHQNHTYATIYRTIQPELDVILKSQFPPAHPDGELADQENKLIEMLKLLEILGAH